MSPEADFDEVGRKLLRFSRKLVTSLRDLWGNLLVAVEKYIQSKTKHLPEVLPKGRRATINSILERRPLQDFLQKFAQESGIALDHVEATFRKYLLEIASDLNYLIFPFWDFFLTWVFGFIYEGFEVDRTSLEKIRQMSGKKPLVFVPNHRSHIDYMLLSYIFYNHKISLPHVCAGANLSFWPLGWIFRKSGGFFIRRSYEGNKLYAAAVEATLEELIREKQNLEFFIEGGRSRTGKLLPPRMGMLSATVQAWFNGAAEDIVLIPTSLSYESVIEEKSYVEEQAGASKKQENFLDLFKLQKYLRQKKGKVYLQFGDPISMKDSLGSARPAEKREKVEELASEITYRINKSAVVTPSSLVADALLTSGGRSIRKKRIEERVEDYLDYLRFKECPLSETFQKFREGAVRDSLRIYVKNRLIQEYPDDDGPLYQVPENRRPVLNYYKNTSIHFFVSMGVLSSLLVTSPGDEIPFRKVEEGYNFLQELLKYEFTFSRRQSLRDHIQRVIQYLEKKGWGRFEEPTIRLSPEGRRRLEPYSSLLRNTLEGYSILWKTLPSLGSRRWEVRDLLKYLLSRGWILYLKEEIRLYESINKFVLQNGLRSFRDLQLLSEATEGWGKRKRVYYTVGENYERSGAALGKRLQTLLK